MKFQMSNAKFQMNDKCLNFFNLKLGFYLEFEICNLKF